MKVKEKKREWFTTTTTRGNNNIKRTRERTRLHQFYTIVDYCFEKSYVFNRLFFILFSPFNLTSACPTAEVRKSDKQKMKKVIMPKHPYCLKLTVFANIWSSWIFTISSYVYHKKISRNDSFVIWFITYLVNYSFKRPLVLA